MECAQINVTGGSGAKSPTTASLPGAYSVSLKFHRPYVGVLLTLARPMTQGFLLISTRRWRPMQFQVCASHLLQSYLQCANVVRPHSFCLLSTRIQSRWVMPKVGQVSRQTTSTWSNNMEACFMVFAPQHELPVVAKTRNAWAYVHLFYFVKHKLISSSVRSINWKVET